MSRERTSSRSKGGKNKKIWDCPSCGNTYKDDTKSIQCDTCDSWICLPCSKFPIEMYDFMSNMEPEKGIKWVCRLCDQLLPVLKEMNNTLGSLMKSNNDRFDAIEEQMKKVECSIGVKVSEEVTGLKEQLMSDISAEIDKKLEEKYKEESDKRYREMNLCFFNLPISEDTNPEARKAHDKDRILELYRTISKEDTPDIPIIKNVFRLRPANVPKESLRKSIPVVKATFVNKHDIRTFLSNAKHIKANPKLSLDMQKVIVSRDLSVKEREANKQLRAELLEKKKDSDRFTIRNGKIIARQMASGGASNKASPSD